MCLGGEGIGAEGSASELLLGIHPAVPGCADTAPICAISGFYNKQGGKGFGG